MADTLDDLIRSDGLIISEARPGTRVYSTCPHCSAHRKTRAHRETKVVGVNIAVDGKSYSGGCNHCGAVFGGRVGVGRNKKNGNGHAGSGESQGSAISATYDYVDEFSNFLFQVCRKANKTAGFPQRTLSATGEWSWGVPDTIRRVLYRLPELLSSVAAGDVVYIVEGEKDANNMHAHGLTATCNPGGASEPGKKSKWKQEYAQCLHGADIVVIPDNDEPGAAHAQEVARSVRRVARRVRILEIAKYWPEVAEKKGGDISDAFEAGRTVEQLETLLAACPDWKDPAARALLSSIELTSTLQHEVFQPLRMIIPKYLPEGLTLFAGRPKMGKSFLSLGGLVSVASGGNFLDQKCERGDVLYLALEDSKPRLQRRLTSMLGAQLENWPERLHYTTRWARLDDGGYDALWEWARSVPDPRLIVIDTITKIRPPRKKDDDPYKADYDAIGVLADLPKTFRLALVCVLHQRKTSSEYGVDTISGTLGQAAAVDQYMLLEKKNDGAILSGEGRDCEPFKAGVKLSNKGWWEQVDLETLIRQRGSKERSAVLAFLADKTSAHFRDIASALDTSNEAAKVLLGRMVADGILVRKGQGTYAIAVPESQEGMPF